MNENRLRRPIPFIENEQFKLWLSKFDHDKRLQTIQHSIFEVLQDKACGDTTLIAALTQICLCCEVRLNRISLPIENISTRNHSPKKIHSNIRLNSGNIDKECKSKLPKSKHQNGLIKYMEENLKKLLTHKSISVLESPTDIDLLKGNKKNLTVKNSDGRNQNNIVEDPLQLNKSKSTDLKRKINGDSNCKETTLCVKKQKLKTYIHRNFKHQQTEKLDLFKESEGKKFVSNSLNRSDNKNVVATVETGKTIKRPIEIKKIRSTECKPKISLDESLAISELKLIKKKLKESESRIDIVQNIMTQISNTFSKVKEPDISTIELNENNIISMNKDVIVPDGSQGKHEYDSIQHCVSHIESKCNESGKDSAHFETESPQINISKNQVENTVQDVSEPPPETINQNEKHDQTNIILEAKSVENQPLLVENNVGKIRLRDINTLMANSEPLKDSNKGVCGSNDLEITNNSNNKTPEETISDNNPSTDIENKNVTETSKKIPKYILESFSKEDLNFMKCYTLMFNELVDSKIEMMGGLLHMGITDALCKQERLKWAEKLFSEESIKTEKQRLDKEFRDNMRQRGIEFSAFLGCIMNKFKKVQVEKMFLALYVRLVGVLLKIDNENVRNLYLSREIIYNMLLRNNYKDKIVMDLLQVNDKEFQNFYCKISCLLKFCNSFYAAEDGSIHKFNADDVEQQQIVEGIAVSETKLMPIINKYFENRTFIGHENNQLNLNKEMCLSYNFENINLPQQSVSNDINTDKSVPMVNKLSGFNKQQNIDKSVPMVNKLSGCNKQQNMDKSVPMVNKLSGCNKHQNVDKSVLMVNKLSGCNKHQNVDKSVPMVNKLNSCNKQQNIDKSVPMVNKLSSCNKQQNILNNSVSIDNSDKNSTHLEHSYADINCDNNSQADTIIETKASQIEIIHISDSEDEVAESPVVSNIAVSQSVTISNSLTVSNKPDTIPENCVRTNLSVEQISTGNKPHSVSAVQQTNNMVSSNYIMVPNTFLINVSGNFKNNSSQPNQSNVSSSPEGSKKTSATESQKKGPFYLVNMSNPNSLQGTSDVAKNNCLVKAVTLLPKANFVIHKRQETNIPVQNKPSPLLHVPTNFVSVNKQKNNLICVPDASFKNTGLVGKINMNNIKCSATQPVIDVRKKSCIVFNSAMNQKSRNVQVVNSAPSQNPSPRPQLVVRNQFVPSQNINSLV